MSTRRTTDLERLTQPGGKVLPDDATIPVLTERLTLPSLELDISLPQPPPPVVAPPAPVAAPPPPAPRPPPPPPPPPVVSAPKPAPPPAKPAPRAEAARSGPPTIPAEGPATVPADAPRTEFPPTVPLDAATTTTLPLAASTTVSAPASTPPIEINWSNAEARVREALLRELQPKLAADIDRQLSERLQPTVVRMLLATITELRPSIDAAIRDVVERAVAAEIARQKK
jgi:hypothetical protein